jgi:uncharacterized membrane protein
MSESVARISTQCVAVAVGIAAIALAATSMSCSPDSPLPPEALDAARQIDCGQTTYEDFGARFFHDYCLHCHNEQLEGDMARTDAPTGINFNTLDQIRGYQRRIRLRAGEQGDMPPSLLPVPRPSEQERLRLIRWLDCGAP